MIIYFSILLLIFIFFYGFMFYPLTLLIFARSKCCKLRGSIGSDINEEGVSVVISVKNEISNMCNKINDLFTLSQTVDSIEIIIVSDGSDDGTDKILKKYPSSFVRLIRSKVNNGKPVSINSAISIARYSTILLTDARQLFDERVLIELLEELKHNRVSCVSGQLFPKKSREGVGVGVDLYWKIEKFIRKTESDLYSSIGCTGAIYSLRSKSYYPIPFDTLLDDVIIPMKILCNRELVKFRSEAHAFDFQTLNQTAETRRKTRTIGGNFQMLFRYPEFLLNRNSLLSFFYFSHKISRLVSPFALLAILGLLIYLIPNYFAKLSFILSLAIVLKCMSFVKFGLIAKFSGFLFLNLMVFRGLLYYLKGSYKKGW